MRKNYFFAASLLLLALSLIAFSDNLITDIHQESNSDPKFIIHGLFLFAWMVILVIQTGLIRKLNYTAHQTLGIVGMFVAIGVVLSTSYVFYAVYEGWGKMPSFVKVNRFFMLAFAVLVLLAYLNREHAEKHKRYLFVGTLYLLLPILDRVNGKIADVDPGLFLVVTWNAFFLSLFVYDWVTSRRIHPITYLGFIGLYVIWVIAFIA